MAGPFSGMKVVEPGVWAARPSCAGRLAGCGADVIKTGPPEVDPFLVLTPHVPGYDRNLVAAAMGAGGLL